MKMIVLTKFLVTFCVFFASSCTTEDEPRPYVPVYQGDNAGGDNREGDPNGDTHRGDNTQGDNAQGDNAQGDNSAGDVTGGDHNQLAFPVRVPQQRSVPCDSATETYWDVDHVCVIDNSELDLEIYFQATPNGCMTGGMFPLPTYGTEAWIKTAQGVHPATGRYDGGGNHHNDFFHFEVQGTLYTLWHSSIGYGWRACAPPDCLRTCEVGATVSTCDPFDPANTYANDGCAREIDGPAPPLPAICVQVAADGSVPPLLDPWQAQASDPDYPLLPCLGDMGP